MTTKKRYLFICQSKSCLKKGSEHIRKTLKNHLKERGFKKQIKLVNTKCMDVCADGPNVVCGDKLFREVDDKKINQILNMCVATDVGSN